MNLAQFVRKWALARPDAPAVAMGSRVLQDYRTLGYRVAALAGGLNSTGLVPGDRVALLMKNVPEFFECLFACWHAGLVAVPINAKLHRRESAYIFEHSNAALCLATPGLCDDAGEAGMRIVEVPSAEYQTFFGSEPLPIHPSTPEALAWLFYTSGTTGRPKGAMISHRNLLTMCHCYINDIDDVPPWRALLHPAPLSHGSGLYALPHLMKGSCQVLPESGGFEPGEIFDLIEAWPGSIFFAAPTMIRRLTTFEEDRNVGGLKSIVFGGAPMHMADTKAYLDRFGPRLSQLYGQGEAPMTITGLRSAVFADRTHPRWEARITSAGIPQSAVEVMTVDETGTPVPPGEIGEIICRSDAVMRGYWNDEDATTRSLRGGWLWTGDMGTFDEDGFLALKDRSKDVIISGGSNIYPREVEEILSRHPAVNEVSVIGRPDPEWGELVVAYIASNPGEQPGEQALDQLCLENIARFKRPKAYRFVEELPKNNYGKILKTKLRVWETDMAAPPP